MAALPHRNIDTEVSTDGTNWKFIGTESHPSWKNTETSHILIVDESKSSTFAYRIRLNHKLQAQPWWTITEESEDSELTLLVEWILSTPETILRNREQLSMILEPFWNDSSPSESISESSGLTD